MHNHDITVLKYRSCVISTDLCRVYTSLVCSSEKIAQQCSGSHFACLWRAAIWFMGELGVAGHNGVHIDVVILAYNVGTSLCESI